MNGDEWTQTAKQSTDTGIHKTIRAQSKCIRIHPNYRTYLNGYGAGADNSGICYIGFNGCAKNLSDPYENVVGETYATFVDYFYYYFVDCGTSVTMALNYASNALNATQPLFSMNPLYEDTWNTSK